jgi:mono/diheme cytochrome c family protein
MNLNPAQAFLGALLILSLSACAASSGSEPVAAARTTKTDAPGPGTRAGSPAVGQTSPASRGFRFADTHCSECHAIGKLAISPNPEAPTFEAVVNTPELTTSTLTAWLRRSHNYPQIMSFEIDPDQIDDLAAYIMTLREDQ